ncbi:MAG: hypothetical protein GTO02_17695, partial [Candidatus Dadabacteria bacterium]|nr:hypothetical protein [Candidatus Dadabacteria bacterium]NIQ16151.1 hypothetical protein [Candidatus Dadabacteria bacterium]
NCAVSLVDIDNENEEDLEKGQLLCGSDPSCCELEECFDEIACAATCTDPQIESFECDNSP